MYLRKRKKKGEGFTLIELLIVIVIIGILISIALPNFKAAQDRAKNASLESNIRTLSMVAQTYTVDWGGNVAQDVNTLYNEATAKNYWKDLKNPFTGESGMGFAISNYSQAVSLITLLQGVKFATAVELASPMMKTTNEVRMIENQASYLGATAVADMDYSKSAMNAVAATTEALPDASTVFGKPGAIVYLSVADDSGNFVILGSVPEKDNTGKSTGKPKFHTKGGDLVMASLKGKGKIAMAQAHSGGGDYASKYGLKDPKLFGEIKNMFAEKTGLLELQKNQAEVNKYKEDLYAKLKAFSGVDPALYDKQAETQKMLEATKNNIVTEQKKI